MIPKIIHYCWLSGGEYPALSKKCIDSWKKILPDYEIVLWDMKKDGIGEVPWVREAFNAKKYAFAADYVRFFALYKYGGIYLDADVEVLKSFDSLLNNRYFIGQEYSGDIEAAVIGCEPHEDWIKYCLDHYNNRHFVKSDGTYDMRPLPMLVNECKKKFDLEVKPFSFFSPKNYYSGLIESDLNTYTIHHFDGKWENNTIGLRLKKRLHAMLFYVFGRKGHNDIVKLLRKVL